MSKSILRDRSYQFAIDIVKFCQILQLDSKEYIISKQLIWSGTSIGVNLSEAQFGQSEADFIHKISIALKAANETAYWLKLTHDTQEKLDPVLLSRLCAECNDGMGILLHG
ncbi:MAG TPA: four helix bundle protein [Cyclobacteriaceae bacterium]|nr:four helix bundle protein [Cyclobacteriaceae bacterium]